MKGRDKLIIGGIVKHNGGGVGFKLTFKNKEQAQYYKKMVYTVLEDDFKVIDIGHGAFDEVR